ncbi:MAG: hypothetical protein B9J98_00635 [Candidatus Terraquivivens tikiterensis]|uniref:Uncharacterized protein n=1 Tax=Candidatus Terraquivivens tikiterensis TaxID=1980982 RepID=A0A2R7YA44_9ARCH|nr:MAG: hypothetical protein B9J98_00635 [Candidatus Terraquivivens tikiterensis]
MFMLIILGSYAAQYYSWSVSYTIKPLTETKTFYINTSGATTATDTLIGTTFVEVVKPGTLKLRIVSKPEMANAFEDLSIKVEFYLSGVLMKAEKTIVSGGTVYDGDLRIEIMFSASELGHYDVKIKVTYQTKAVTGTVQDSFPIQIWFVEGS